MSEVLLNPAELRARGFESLVKSLGWVNAVRFVNQFEVSHLNYMTERDQILPNWTAEELVQALQNRSSKNPKDAPRS